MTQLVEYRTLIVIAVLACALAGAHAQEAKEQAQAGAVADGVSSVVGIAAGAPLNPVLPLLGAAFKAATLDHAEKLPEAERPRAYAMAAAGWQGSAAGNACAALSVVSGGSFLPACLAVGAAWGWKTWTASERERQDAERCAAKRAAARKPKMRCPAVRRRIEQPAPPVPSVITAQEFMAQ
ncbi:hypothetical protein ACPWT1_12165 [Ramlibacter sp. MMS24-I3-19]|uniref:hypothetical protein n=1 Tax=Ramlibacter sp. MMS24-I3-19 TaxID=3416606 RepID=UPI003CFE6A4A